MTVQSISQQECINLIRALNWKMEFRRKKIDDAKEFLVDIKDGVDYVEGFLEKSPDGIYSKEVEGANRNNLYVGTAGILHMYVQLNQVLEKSVGVESKKSTGTETEKSTGTETEKSAGVEVEKSADVEAETPAGIEVETLKMGKLQTISIDEKITEITKYLSRHVLDGVELAEKNGEFVKGMSEAFYSGIAGIGLVLNEVYRLCQDENAKAGVETIIEYYEKHSTETENYIYWTDNSPIFFDGGITLFFIDCLITGGVTNLKRIREIVIKSANYILSKGTRHGEKAIEFDYHHVDFKHKEPNFEFGTAGIGYLFAKVYEMTNDEKYLEASVGAAKYLNDISVKQRRGYLIPYKLGVYDNLFYLGNCHGPVGTSKLYYELYKITDDKYYLEQVYELVKGAESLGAPFKQSPGFWNTTCVCCGPAGYVPLFVGLYKETGDEKWKKKVHDVGEILAGTKENNHWNIAFDRTRPDVITSPAGYFTGAAGIVVALLQVYCLEKNIDGVSGFIDDPYSFRGKIR